MKSIITFLPLARQDVLEQMLYLEEQANEEVALLYHDAVFATCRMLAEQPLSGKSFKTRTGSPSKPASFSCERRFSKVLNLLSPE